jgi:hypothetical protein
VFRYLQPFGLEAAHPRRDLELLLWPAALDVACREDREVLAYDLVGGVALDALRPGVPAPDVAVRVRRKMA